MKRKVILWTIAFVLLIGFLIPQRFSMPVEGANEQSFNPQSYWYYPWGKSVTHKGVDIFAKEETPVKSSTDGIVLYTGNIKMGGNVALVLGPKWRIHYYAHLKTIDTDGFTYVDRNTRIGTVGTTGNAKGKSPHLHYSIVTLLPYLWRIDLAKQGWKKMFYLNPIDYLQKSNKNV